MTLTTVQRPSPVLAFLLLAAVMAASCTGADGGFAVAEGINVVRYTPDDRRDLPGFSVEELLAEGSGAREISDRFLAGRVAVVNFWGSWCGPCRREKPELVALYREYSGAGVRFLGVNVRDTRANALAFKEEFGVPYPSIYNPASSVAHAFRVNLMPTTVVLDRRGRIAARIIGAVRGEDLRALIEEELL